MNFLNLGFGSPIHMIYGNMTMGIRVKCNMGEYMEWENALNPWNAIHLRHFFLYPMKLYRICIFFFYVVVEAVACSLCFYLNYQIYVNWNYTSYYYVCELYLLSQLLFVYIFENCYNKKFSRYELMQHILLRKNLFIIL